MVVGLSMGNEESSGNQKDARQKSQIDCQNRKKSCSISIGYH